MLYRVTTTALRFRNRVVLGAELELVVRDSGLGQA